MTHPRTWIPLIGVALLLGGLGWLIFFRPSSPASPAAIELPEPPEDPAPNVVDGATFDPAFRKYLLANPLLMEVPGAKVIRRPDGRFVLLAVASTVLKDDSPQERLRAEQVCRIKALASIVAEREGVQIAHFEEVRERTVVEITNEKESGTSVAEVLLITKAKVEGIARDLPVIARWKSKPGDVYYLAIGTICDGRGTPVQE